MRGVSWVKGRFGNIKRFLDAYKCILWTVVGGWEERAEAESLKNNVTFISDVYGISPSRTTAVLDGAEK